MYACKNIVFFLKKQNYFTLFNILMKNKPISKYFNTIFLINVKVFLF